MFLERVTHLPQHNFLLPLSALLDVDVNLVIVRAKSQLTLVCIKAKARHVISKTLDNHLGSHSSSKENSKFSSFQEKQKKKGLQWQQRVCQKSI